MWHVNCGKATHVESGYLKWRWRRREGRRVEKVRWGLNKVGWGLEKVRWGWRR